MTGEVDPEAPWCAEVLAIDVSFLRQVVKHNPPGSYGDCFRTTIACLIGANTPYDVPHFVALNCAVDGDVDPLGWSDLRDARLWLREKHDLDLFPLIREDADELGVYYKATVKSPAGVNHSVLARQGRVRWCPNGWPIDGMEMLPDESAWVISRPWSPDPVAMVDEWRANVEANDG